MAKRKIQEQMSNEIHLLGDILGKVIRQQAGIDIFELEEGLRALTKARRADNDERITVAIDKRISKLSLAESEAVARAFTTYFALINLTEEHHRIRVLRQRERKAHPKPLKESIANAIETLWRTGIEEREMAQILAKLHIELVFTAHPTEAKRRTVLSKLRRVSRALKQLESGDILPHEQKQWQKYILAEVTSLWVTEQSRTQKPTVTDEVRTGLYYLEATIWDVIPELYAHMRDALAEYYPNLTMPADFLKFGSWIGGDRDGNPFVTADITAETLRLHRGLAVERHRRLVKELDRSLSASRRLTNIHPDLEKSLIETPHPASTHIAYLQERYPWEPYRLRAAMLADNLAETSAEDVVARLQGVTNEQPPTLSTKEDLHQALRLLADSLEHSGLGVISEVSLQSILVQTDVFGLHGARLDIRQESDYHTAVLGELLAKLNLCPDYEALSPTERVDLLTKLLIAPIPDLSQLDELSANAQETLALFQLLYRAASTYGAQIIGPYIISMTRGADDVLLVLLLGRWTGLCLVEGRESEYIGISPLFETRADLEAAGEVMGQLFTHPSYSRHLTALKNEQNIMIGYSDSNKDAGYLAAQWELFQAQERLASSCRAHEVGLILFHGRGGTIARGGGPANRAVRAQPAGSVDGRIRITEQGEVISERYSHPAIAKRHLEQLVHAVLLASSPHHEVQAKPHWREAMTVLAETSYRAYRLLVYETPELLVYWNQATPIHEIGELRIGSRPARRSSNKAFFTSLRAIPWGFSWMQSRHVLPGWFGVGTALESFAKGNDKNLVILTEMYEDWPFFNTAIDNAQMSLGKADMGIARLYANLVEDEVVREEIYDQILTEYNRATYWILRLTGQNEILDNAPTLKKSIKVRNPYVDPLNFIQVNLLRQLRTLPDHESEEAKRLAQVVALTINGVAVGLKNTG